MFNGLVNVSLFAVSTSVSDTLQYADMSVITNSNCMVNWGPVINDKMICVSTADRRSPCNV